MASRTEAQARVQKNYEEKVKGNGWANGIYKWNETKK